MNSELTPSEEPFIGHDTAPENRLLAPGEYDFEDADLREALEQIWGIADKFHLEPFQTNFEVVPAKIMSQLAAYNGLHGSFSHWTRGREYRQTKTMYDWGMSKIYELVINSDPSQAFLLENNPPIENKFVMAHVLGHTDFFKNNMMFRDTRRDMPDAAIRSSKRLVEYEETEGSLAVEKFLDAALALQEHVDPYQQHRPSREDELRTWGADLTARRLGRPALISQFDDLFGRSEEPTEPIPSSVHIPPQPDRDLLGVFKNHAPYLEDWQRDALDIVRNEALYFYPQRRTKIMNEGWAAYWHKRIMREMGDRGKISSKDNEQWWLLHSRVVAPGKGQLNPYYLGMMMYEYIEDYHNGMLEPEENSWLEKEGIPVHPRYEGPLEDSPASAVLREAMMYNDDQSFIRNHFNKIVADRMNMFMYDKQTRPDGEVQYVVQTKGWEQIRDKLVESMDNSGSPYIVVTDCDYNSAQELYLRHEYTGQPLDPAYIRKTLPHAYTLWQRPVHIETVEKQGKGIDQKVLYRFDGSRSTKVNIN